MIIHDITSTALRNWQQNVLITEIKIKTKSTTELARYILLTIWTEKEYFRVS